MVVLEVEGKELKQYTKFIIQFSMKMKVKEGFDLTPEAPLDLLLRSVWI